MENIQIEGSFDVISGAHALGWVRDANAPDVRLTVNLIIDGAFVCSVVADRHRLDLDEAGIGDGCYSFDLPIPILLITKHRDYEVQVTASLGDELVCTFPAKTLQVNEANLPEIVEVTVGRQNQKIAQGFPVDQCIARVRELLLLDPDSTLVHDRLYEDRVAQDALAYGMDSDAYRAAWQDLARYRDLLEEIERSFSPSDN